MSQLQGALIHLFQKHRIVIWYDAKHELRGEFESLILPGVELIELDNNAFGIKYRILREQPGKKFLIYHDGPRPSDLENWLLDIELAHVEFRADQHALWLSELELGPDFLELVQQHNDFFSAAERRSALKALLNRQDTALEIRFKMLAVCAECGPRLDEILEALLAELAAGQNARMQCIESAELDSFLWKRCERTFGYHSETPGVQDFAIALFQNAYRLELGEPASMTGDALVFIRRWKDSLSHHQAFEDLSNQNAEILHIEQDLHNRSAANLAGIDLFRVIDQKIISELAHQVAERTIPAAESAAIIRQRRRLHWFGEFAHLYNAIDYAAQFLAALDQATLDMISLSEGVQRYSQNWHRLDFLYRKVVFHARKSGQSSVLERLIDQVENLYSNNYLLKLNNNWQQVVDGLQRWDSGDVNPQREFFNQWVAPMLRNRKKVYVIISDALRYEVADELLSLIRQEDRYEATLEPALAELPTYTQLGMAALLPNRELTIPAGSGGSVVVDGISAQGMANREKILKQGVAALDLGQGAALSDETLLGFNREAMRDLLRDTDVVYIYHNHIDALGDKIATEERVFEAVEETLAELMTIIKKLTAANATNLLVTADHGFIYQNRPIEESDFSSADVAGCEIVLQERRFVLGIGLQEHAGLRRFTALQLGRAGDVEVQIPKSIGRLRLKGSGSRYVHGGAALQEVVIPVLSINKRRERDIYRVEVEILRGPASIITAGQFSAAFYQAEPVSEKVKARTLRAGIYTQAGQLISDQHTLVFDLTADAPREREVMARFILTQEANQANNQEVLLKLEEQIPGTSHYSEYKSVRYMLRRSFTSDFDF